MMAGAEIDPATLAPESYINQASGFGISFPLLKGVQGALNHTLEELEETQVQAHYASGLEACLDDMKNWHQVNYHVSILKVWLALTAV